MSLEHEHFFLGEIREVMFEVEKVMDPFLRWRVGRSAREKVENSIMGI